MPSIGKGWGPPALNVSAGRTTLPKAIGFKPAGKLDTGVKEASDVVALPGGRFLVVGDTSDKVGVIGADGFRRTIKLEGLPKHKPSQFEGVAYDPVKKNLLLSREESRQVLRYDWDPAGEKDPKLKKTYDYSDEIGGPANKGIEGLTWVPGASSPTGRPVLLGVQEGNPRELVVFDDNGGGKPRSIKLDDDARKMCADLSAISLDPVSGQLFVTSDESSRVAQLQLVEGKHHTVEARLVSSFAVSDEKGKPLPRIEGLTFNEKGDLFVLTENDGVLRRFERQ